MLGKFENGAEYKRDASCTAREVVAAHCAAYLNQGIQEKFSLHFVFLQSLHYLCNHETNKLL